MKLRKWSNFALFAVLVSLFSSLSYASSECDKTLDPQRLKELNQYLHTGDIAPMWLVTEAVLYDQSEKEGSARRTYTEKEKMVFRKIVEDLNTIDTLLKAIEGHPKAAVPYDKETRVASGYKFLRTNYIGHYVISITREKDNFYWTIGVQHEGDFWKDGNNVKIKGFHHIGTNGSLADVREALREVYMFFPKPE